MAITKIKRTHNTNKVTINLKQEYKQSNPTAIKPKGLWYGINDGWSKWCNSEMPHWIRKKHYTVILKDNIKLLVLNTESDIMEFHKKYVVKKKEIITCIDWEKVAREYDGIEIRSYDRYNNVLRFDIEMLWYYGWDCSSGCIWNLDKIKVKEVK